MNRDQPEVGAYLVGARGSIGVATMAGHVLLGDPTVPRHGLVSRLTAFSHLPFLPSESWVLGGCDVSSALLLEVLESHLESGITPAADRSEVREALTAGERQVDDLAELARAVAVGDAGAGEIVAEVRQRLVAFKERIGVERVIVLNCASTEPLPETREDLFVAPDWETLSKVLEASGEPPPWGPCYAAAALLEGCAYVNFTPNLGTDLPALSALAHRRRLPHAGKDGKTGETLLKSVLAPMFAERGLPVLTWQGYNMLGNSDGRSLNDPRARAAKVASKDQQLRALLPESRQLHTHVGIDYVPSLGDWKTAWNFIHFEGFLGARMSMQITWNGCDTALAAPLVLDLLRFCELAWRQQETGHLRHLDAFFKSPPPPVDHDFRRQMQRLRDYAAALHWGASHQEAG